MTSELTQPTAEFSIKRSFKLGTFHIGSSLTDLVSSAVWNRVLIADLGVAAWPIGLLTALRYLLAPLTLWAGHRSDTRPILGSRRIAYIWLGRLLMLLSLPLLPFSLAFIAADRGSVAGWALAVASFLLYGVGTLISGAPFLALVHDSAPYARRGQAVSIVQFMLVVSFAFIPVLYARAMPAYDPVLFGRLVLMALIGAAFFWTFSVWGEERHWTAVEEAHPGQAVRPSLREALRAIWHDRPARRYALFLGTSAFFAFMQDAVLEPFGGDVFGLPAGETTRFNAYWGLGVLVSMAATYAITRRRPPDRQVTTTGVGLALMALPMLLLAFAAQNASLPLVRPVLVLFGFGFGTFTVGGVSLLMAMSREERAGAYLALWSVIQLVLRGAGIAMGGVIRDLALAASGALSSAYAAVFFIEALGLVAAIVLLARVGVSQFAAQRTQRPAHEALALAGE